MIELLDEDVQKFATIFVSSSYSPVLVWDQDMRQHLRKLIYAVCSSSTRFFFLLAVGVGI